MLRRVRRILALSAVVLVGILAALALTAATLISGELTPESLSKRLTLLLERETTVEKTALSLFPFPHVVAEGVTVVDVLTARSIEMGPSLTALAQGRMEISSARIEGATVELARGPDGNFATDLAWFDRDSDDGEPAAFSEIEVVDSRLLLRDAEGAPPEEILIQRLRIDRRWPSSKLRLDLSASLGPDGMAGLVHAEGAIDSQARVEVVLRAVGAQKVLPYLPADWDVRDASGVVDGRIVIERGAVPETTRRAESDEPETRVELDLALRGGGADFAGVRLAGETRLAGNATLGSNGFGFSGGSLSAEAIQAFGYSATKLRAEFDWSGDELELHGLELGTVSAGLLAAAALGMPGADGLPLLVRVEKAGKLSLHGSLNLPTAEDPTRHLSVPSLTAIGTELALVYDPGPDETITGLRIDRLHLDGYVAGRTPTLELEAHILGAENGRITASGSLGPLNADQAVWTHPITLKGSVEGAPPDALLPYIPDSWPVPRALGPVDMKVDVAGTLGDDLTGEATVVSRFGVPPDALGRVVAELRAEPVTDPEDAPITIRVSVLDLDLDLVSPLPEDWRIDEAEGRLNAEGTLHARRDGDLEGNFEIHVSECRVVTGEWTLGGSCQADGHFLRSGGGLGLPAFNLTADTARFREFEGERFRMRGLFIAPALQIESASVDVWDGDLEGGGTVLFERPPRYEFEAVLMRANVAKLMRDPDDSERARDPNRIDATVRVAGTWGDSDSWLEPLEGGGQIDIYDGAVTGMPLRRAIAEALLSIVPKSGALRGDRALPRTRLQHGVIPFTFEKGEIQVEGIEVVTPDYRIRAHGQIQSDFGYEFEGNVNLTSDGLRNTLALVGAPRITRRTLTLPAIPLDAVGSFTDGKDADVRVDLSEVTVNVARGLLGLPLAAGKTAAGAVRRGIGALRPGSRNRDTEPGEEPR